MGQAGRRASGDRPPTALLDVLQDQRLGGGGGGGKKEADQFSRRQETTSSCPIQRQARNVMSHTVIREGCPHHTLKSPLNHEAGIEAMKRRRKSWLLSTQHPERRATIYASCRVQATHKWFQGVVAECCRRKRPLLATARKRVASGEILLWMTPSEAPKALQASECSELLDPAGASFGIFAQRQPGKFAQERHWGSPAGHPWIYLFMRPLTCPRQPKPRTLCFAWDGVGWGAGGWLWWWWWW